MFICCLDLCFMVSVDGPVIQRTVPYLDIISTRMYQLWGNSYILPDSVRWDLGWGCKEYPQRYQTSWYHADPPDWTLGTPVSEDGAASQTRWDAVFVTENWRQGLGEMTWPEGWAKEWFQCQPHMSPGMLIPLRWLWLHQRSRAPDCLAYHWFCSSVTSKGYFLYKLVSIDLRWKCNRDYWIQCT